MTLLSLDPYRPADSPLHSLDARPKVLLTAFFILSCALLPDTAWAGFLLSWLVVTALAVRARLGAGYALKRSLAALPFALAAVTVVFTLPGAPLFRLSLGAWRLTATDAGLTRFLAILARAWLSLQAAALLVGTTPFPEIVHALRHLGLPSVFAAVINFMYRYLFLLAEEALRLLRARQARSARLDGRRGGGTLLWRARVTGGMAGQLFLRSYARSERVYAAMTARGYRGELLVLHPRRLGRRDWLSLGMGAGFLAAIQCLGRWL